MIQHMDGLGYNYIQQQGMVKSNRTRTLFGLSEKILGKKNHVFINYLSVYTKQTILMSICKISNNCVYINIQQKNRIF